MKQLHNDYKKLGLDEPDQEQHFTEDKLEAMHKELRKRPHRWGQRGNLIFCKACPFEHGHLVKADLQLQGTDPQGAPILDKVKVQ